jgi:hypothetical protein
MNKVYKVLFLVCLLLSFALQILVPILIMFWPGAPGPAKLQAGPTLDIYGGYNIRTCTNSNTAFSIDKSNSIYPVLCDPLGHAYYLRGPFTFDLNAITTADESGTGYNTYATTKYGSAQVWANQDIALMQAWGWNALGAYANTVYPMPWNTTNPIPYIMFGNVDYYSMRRQNGYGTCAPKDLTYTLSVAGWTDLIPSGGMVDYPDPCYGTYQTGFMNDTGTGTSTTVGAQSLASKHYVVGWSNADSDNHHGMNAAPVSEGFTAQQSNNDISEGYVGIFVSPLNFANSSQAQIYTDGTVYEKKTLHDNLAAKYANVAAINTAWGSSYTTELTSGTCFGSLMPAWLCPSPSAAASLSGSGSGPYTATLSTTVSKYSVYIAVAGVIVGGDTGAGSLYGPTISAGTINYATGAISVTFTGTPGAVTAGYIQNGWKIGTGLMDEDCRAGNAGYCGTKPLTSASAGLQVDANALTTSMASAYATTSKTELETWAAGHGFTGNILFLGPTASGSWGIPPSKYVLAGYSGQVDALIEGGVGGTGSTPSGFGRWNSSMLDFVHTAMGDIPVIETSYRTANEQSAMTWINLACNHSGTSVSCTSTTPNLFTTGRFNIDAHCNHSDYSVNQVSFTAASNVVTYVLGMAPSESSATCTVNPDDYGTQFASQSLKCADFETDVAAAPNDTYSATGVHPTIGYLWWGWQDNWAEGLNWGVVSVRDNPYNGTDNTNSSQACGAPNGAYLCGSENTQHGTPNLGNCISAITAANVNIDSIVSVPVPTGNIGVPFISIIKTY